MKQPSVNFEFLRIPAPALADLASLSEQLLHIDPGSSLVRLRSYCEQSVKLIYDLERLPKLFRPQLIDLINDDAFRSVASPALANNLHFLRIQGNGPAHGEEGDPRSAAMALRQAHEIGRYLAIRYFNIADADIPAFNEPAQQAGNIEELKKDRKAFEELAKKKAEEVDLLLVELEATRAKLALTNSTPEERNVAFQRSQQTANALQWDESKTRELLIDTMLTKAGWQIDNKAEVSLEFEVQHQPTQSGIGYADYVLWDESGKPVAVIEAKKSAESLMKGREQARIYADGLEKMYGQRPVIFFSNGYEVQLWDDCQYNSPRKVYGLYGKNSLAFLIFQRTGRTPEPERENPRLDITDRPYQIQAIKTIAERFQNQRRNALIVQATGTGKTRVAIGMCELLLRTGWVKRVLFLCDRNELRKQGADAFKSFLPSEPRCVIGEQKQVDDNARIYISTYPSMMNRFEQFDIGFFDLIIADESHRSIYNKYRDLFLYFDALTLGLTATPVKFISRNTYSLFGCEDQDPTFQFSLDEAINNNPPYLVPFRVKDLTTEFLREGIKYDQLTDEQRADLEEQLGDAAEDIDYEGDQIGKRVFNADTSRIILRNLMENGLKDANGALVGKTIIFARSQKHAEHLEQVFCADYPQYGNKVCKVIHNKVPRAEALIDEFKQGGNDFRIAISVDMLDTGVDVPEVVNLVFAKPVKSWVKFWQMIGRGTRLCRNLFGPGKDKAEFLIFDHYGNFQFFEEEYQEADVAEGISLLQSLFETRLALAVTAVEKNHMAVFQAVIPLLRQDINDLPQGSIQVREKLRDIHILQQDGVLEAFSPATRILLNKTIAPLMGNRPMSDKDAAAFDRLVAELEHCLVQQASCFEDKKLAVIEWVNELAVTIKAVQAQSPLIAALGSSAWWSDADIAKLETMRLAIRPIAKFRTRRIEPGQGPLNIDVAEAKEGVYEVERKVTITSHTEAMAYKAKVKQILAEMLNNNPTLQKIHLGEPVSETELDSLTSQVLTSHPGVELSVLAEFYPNEAVDLQTAIRELVGLDPQHVESRFAGFLHQHPSLTAKQVQYINLLKTYIADNGFIRVDKLYEPPFTRLHEDGIDGVFQNQDAHELIVILGPFLRPQTARSAPESTH